MIAAIYGYGNLGKGVELALKKRSVFAKPKAFRYKINPAPMMAPPENPPPGPKWPPKIT